MNRCSYLSAPSPSSKESVLLSNDRWAELAVQSRTCDLRDTVKSFRDIRIFFVGAYTSAYYWQHPTETKIQTVISETLENPPRLLPNLGLDIERPERRVRRFASAKHGMRHSKSITRPKVLLLVDVHNIA